MSNLNQNKYSIIKLRWGFLVTTITLNFNLLTLNSQAQIPFSIFDNQFSLQLSSINYQLITKRKNKEPEPIDFSSLGRSGQQTAGESRGSCPQSTIPLTAIAPKSNESKTITSHPRWWFYLPYDKSEISRVEFVLQDRHQNDLLRENVTISTKSPYFSTTIPQNHLGVQINRWYRWYLKVYCSERKNTVPLYVSGWVQRIVPHNRGHISEQKVALTVTEYIQNNLWLDAINLLLKTQIDKSQASIGTHDWDKIINSSEIDLKLPIPNLANGGLNEKY